MRAILLSDTIGGGEILQYVGQDYGKPTYQSMNNTFINQLGMISGVKVLIVLLLLVIMVITIVRIFEIRSPLKGKAITNEFNHLEAVRKRDEQILRANKFINIITRIIEKSPLVLNKTTIEYWQYNLERADIRIPGGHRVMKPQELNALIKFTEVLVTILAIAIAILISAPIGLILIILTWTIGGTVPMTMIRSIVKTKDNEVIEHFADLYLMLHYVLLASANTPISGILKSFDKTTNSAEMHKFVDCCIHYIDTYGEYEATRHIGKQYREVPEVSKLMRLIRQANEGGDVRAELMGFRTELLSAKKYAIEKRMEKIVAQAKASFNLLVPVLIQAIISAMAIYLEDLSLIGSFM